MNIQPLKVHDIKLGIDSDTGDFSWYQQRGVFEERVSLLYKLIHQDEYSDFIDIGANYGFISLIMKSSSPTINIVAVEADPRLVSVIKHNLEINAVDDALVLNAIVSDTMQQHSSFSLNPKSTLDNRVSMKSWEQVSVPSMTLDHIIANYCSSDAKLFIKIDTQGFEQFVLKGAEKSLQELNSWMMKMEFAPNWLKSQGTDPLSLLHYLCGRYEVVEAPARIPFGTCNLADLFRHPITNENTQIFLDYVVSLNQKQLGWVDLLVRPKKIKRDLPPEK